MGGAEQGARSKYFWMDHELEDVDDLNSYMSEDYLVMDIGMGVGSDTRFYLFQGYPVVTVE